MKVSITKHSSRKDGGRGPRSRGHLAEAILKAAGGAFARCGFEATTMRDIAQSCGCTAPTLYAYFKGKADILAALVRGMDEALAGPFARPFPAGLTFGQKLELLLHDLLAFAERWREPIGLFVDFKTGFVAPVEGVRHILEKKYKQDPVTRLFAEWIRRHATREDLGGRDPEMAAFLLKGIAQAVFGQWMSQGGKGRLVDKAPFIRDVFLHGVGGRR